MLNALFVMAAMFSAGLLYHFAAFGFAIGFTMLFLQDMSFYLNHFYLVVVLCFAYAFVPANRFWSLDALFGLVRASPTVPYWTIFLTRYLVSVVYVHAGLAKMNEDWIRYEFVGKCVQTIHTILTPFIADVLLMFGCHDALASIRRWHGSSTVITSRCGCRGPVCCSIRFFRLRFCTGRRGRSPFCRRICFTA